VCFFSVNCSQQHQRKRQFVDELRKAINPTHYKQMQTLSEGAVVTCVRMCKASTYIRTADSTNVLITLVKSIVLDLKVGMIALVINTQFHHHIRNLFFPIRQIEISSVTHICCKMTTMLCLLVNLREFFICKTYMHVNVYAILLQ